MGIITIIASAFVFDLDGTLIDSNALYEQVWKRWSKRVGVNSKQVLLMSHGRRHQEVIESILPDTWSITDALKIYYEEEDKESNALEIRGAKDFLSQLPIDRWAIVTGSGRNLTKKRLEDCNFPVPNILIAAEDVLVGKPDPTGYNLAIKKLNIPSSECWIFEDAPSGIKAAKAANANVIVVVGTFDKFDKTIFSENITISNFKAIQYIGMTSDNKLKITITT